MVTRPSAPALVLDLFRRIKAIEQFDGSWPGADVVDILNAWFAEHQLNPDDPAPDDEDDDAEHIYRRTVTVETSCLWPLDDADLDAAIAASITGTTVRAEFKGLTETAYVELRVLSVDRIPTE